MVYVCFECGSDTKSDPDSYLVQLFLGLYSDTGFSFQGFTCVIGEVRANIVVCCRYACGDLYITALQFFGTRLYTGTGLS